MIAVVDDDRAVVPVWALATGDTPVPAIEFDASMSPERLAELRAALVALARQPVATLEAHRVSGTVDRSRGVALDAASPLAESLSWLIRESTKNSKQVAEATTGGEVLYRMVVPAKVAAQMGQGVIQPMASKAAAGGIYSALTSSSGIAAQATFVPASRATILGAAGGAGAGAAAAGGAATVVTIAAPLVLMAVAVGVSVQADRQRQRAIRHITDLLEQLHDDKLDEERNSLDGCRDAIDKATALLLDQGKLGVSLGLDTAVHAISTALAAAERRLKAWESALDALPDGEPVEIRALTKPFPGIDGEGGGFRAHVELAALAIALKHRVIVLQAVEHAQQDEGNPFENFLHALAKDRKSVEELQSRITRVLGRLGSLELRRPRGLRIPTFTPAEVDRLLRAQNRLHALSPSEMDTRPTDVAIEIIREKDGSLVVFPALPA